MEGMDADDTPDRRVARRAAQQHGVVSRDDLLEAGLGRGAIAHRIRVGRLHPIHRGVYAVGHPTLSERGRWLAAVLACGDRALLSHACAAAHLGLRPASPARIDVTLDTRAGRDPSHAIRFHRPRTPVPQSEREVHDAIPVTSVSRTLLDLAAIVSVPSLARAVEQAEALRVFDLRAVHDTLARHPRHPGAASLRAVLETYRDDVLTRSKLEAIFLALCATHGVPRPCAVNTLVHGHEVDFLWRQQRLVVDTDGGRTHGTRAAFERDRARDAQLTVAGYRVVRFTERQVTTDPASVATTLRALVQERSMSSIR